MAGDGVNGLDVALETSRFSRIDQDKTLGSRKAPFQLLCIDRFLRIHGRRESASFRCFHVAAFGMPRSFPARVTAIEQRHPLVTGPAEHPPEPRRQPSGEIVIDDHLTVVGNAPATKASLEFSGFGQWMAARLLRHRAGEIDIEIGVHGPGYVSRFIVLPPLGRLQQ